MINYKGTGHSNFHCTWPSRWNHKTSSLSDYRVSVRCNFCNGVITTVKYIAVKLFPGIFVNLRPWICSQVHIPSNAWSEFARDASEVTVGEMSLKLETAVTQHCNIAVLTLITLGQGQWTSTPIFMGWISVVNKVALHWSHTGCVCMGGDGVVTGPVVMTSADNYGFCHQWLVVAATSVHHCHY